jgi:glycosyltransferase involved in cell wall biosynthesis
MFVWILNSYLEDIWSRALPRPNSLPTEEQAGILVDILFAGHQQRPYNTMTIAFSVITPTFNRRTLLQRHLKRIGRQTHQQWKLFVVHDGPNPSIKSLVENFGKRDSRICYLETASLANDCGATPRLEGLNRAITDKPVADYVVFWDDDNAYAGDALERIAHALENLGRPDLLLVSVKRGFRTIPPKDVPIRSLQVGQLDTACLIFRPDLARDAYSNMLQHGDREQILRFNDFLTYHYVSQLTPTRSIKHDLTVLVCQHDGLRWGPYLRSILKLPALGIARRLNLGR